MKKLLFLIAVFFMFIIPTFAWDNITYYPPYEVDNSLLTNCGDSGYFNYSKQLITPSDSLVWRQGYANGVANNAYGLTFAFKYDLPAQKTYELQWNFGTGGPTSYLNVNTIQIFTGQTCGNTFTTGNISLIGFSKGSDYVRIRFYTNSIVSNWRVESVNTSNYIMSGDWSISSVVFREIDTTGTNEIITNNTQNTQTIINNQNNNTQSIINNQNNNTQQMIEANKVCDFIDKNDIYLYGKYFNSNGSIANGGDNLGITDYIKITSSDTLINVNNSETGANQNFCFYNDNKVVISCVASPTYNNNQNITIPSDTSYARFGISSSSNKPTFKLCKNGQQATTDAITSDSIPTGNDFLDELNDMLPTDNTISSLITLPLSLYSKVLDSINGTCSSITLGSLYNTNLIMPCIDIESYIGSSLWALIDAIISGGFVIIIAKKMVKAFHSFSELKEGDVINND